MSPSAWLFLGTLMTAVVGLSGAVVTVISAKSSAKSQERAEAAKTSVDKSKADVDNLRNIISGLNEHIERLQNWHTECEARCDECVKENQTLRDQIAALTRRVRCLENGT